ncbi:TolB family protein [Dictyobacter aurantiacus]|uniref:Dipeptidylpeptidase IV N-terminal domain-containing protein n=1 Tax=Dictyobacter aurantiacus TaxID=1936993 RepID=A0A401ZDL5_9CHLR|nr:hypothetical protein [Dictyobacter aurantiacus]GCE04967.1 hypothetical protein KDAU_22960 [Dictyobacter aurantiacus]
MFRSPFILAYVACALIVTCFCQSSADAQPMQTKASGSNCPPPGSARTAFMPALAAREHHQYVVYILMRAGQQFLVRYDPVNGQKTTLVRLDSDDYTVDARVSPDGEWILLKRSAYQGRQALQLVRIDGSYLQTLYCAPFISNFLLSPDQRYVVFDRSYENQRYNGISTYSIDLRTGTLRLVLRQTADQSGYEPLKWAGNHSLYMTESLTGIGGGGPFPLRDRFNLYLLRDVSLDQSRQATNLKLLLTTPDPCSCLDMDVTPDNASAITSTCTTTSDSQGTAQTGPARIQIQSLHGGSARVIYSLSNSAITYVRAISPTTLLFVVGNLRYTFDASSFTLDPRDEELNGLWTIRTDGTALTRISIAASGRSSDFPQFAYTAGDILSHDNQHYVVQNRTPGSRGIASSIVIGSLTPHGKQTTVETTQPSDQLHLIGWAETPPSRPIRSSYVRTSRPISRKRCYWAGATRWTCSA